MVTTKIETQPRGGGEKIAELPAEIMTYGERLNRAGPISFRLAYEHPLCTRDNVSDRHEAVITRNGQVVWCGPILTVDEPPPKKGSPHLVAFGGEGLWHYSHRWFVTSTLNFNDVDQFTIARTLINHHQNKAGGDFGIETSGSETSGVLRDRTYLGYEQKNIGSSVEELAEVENGFDFEIDPGTRRFVPHYPEKGSRKPDLIWDERTIRAIHRRIDGTKQASQVRGIGAGEADSMLRFALQDAAAVDTYLLTQATYTNKSVSVAATLQDHVRRELALFKNSPETIALTVSTSEPEVFSYQVGDTGQVRYPSSYEPINRFMRLVGRDIVWEAGEEQAVLYVEPA